MVFAVIGITCGMRDCGAGSIRTRHGFGQQFVLQPVSPRYCIDVRISAGQLIAVRIISEVGRLGLGVSDPRNIAQSVIQK